MNNGWAKNRRHVIILANNDLINWRIYEISYGHMGGKRLRTYFTAENRVITWRCGDRTVSKETYCVAYNLGGVTNHVFAAAAAAAVINSGSAAIFCLIRRTYPTVVHSMWPLLLKRFQ